MVGWWWGEGHGGCSGDTGVVAGCAGENEVAEEQVEDWVVGVVDLVEVEGWERARQ